jgi:hypothetical protein
LHLLLEDSLSFAIQKALSGPTYKPWDKALAHDGYPIFKAERFQFLAPPGMLVDFSY